MLVLLLWVWEQLLRCSWRGLYPTTFEINGSQSCQGRLVQAAVQSSYGISGSRPSQVGQGTHSGSTSRGGCANSLGYSHQG
ncbi:hypothetical protein R3W88_029563 [Solanum pinnatisectum]|uniref:Secreted protein n=1 Tax=Solanum pinnatisectum TaxID=50273 RepID=A0AAV9K5Q9_9SOLN|nr:hypothetical protein R3W88_029563 [Solanum pinnatisectum]